MENENYNENQETKPVWNKDDYEANLNTSETPDISEAYEESAESDSTENANETYKENIKALKKEYKASKKEKKKGSSAKAVILSALISSVCTALCTAIAVLAVLAPVFIFPNIFGSDSDNTDTPVQEQQQEGGQIYVPNKETITIEDHTTDVCTAVYSKVSPSIVGIRIVQVGGSFLYPTTQIVGEGTGTIYSEDGLIITNYHVVEAAINSQYDDYLGSAELEVRVYFDTTLQEYFVADIIGGDSRTDLALLKISLTGLTPVEFADSDEILVGSDAIVMGGGGGIEFIDSVNKGIISGLHRNITTDTGVLYDLIQTDAAINPGNSGGALLNSEGKLIGICFLKISADAYDNMAFAIPSNTVKNIISQIEKDGSADSPYIGVSIDTTYTKQDSDKFNYPMGALVGAVEEGKSADRAGIKKGDIITEFNGTTVTSYDELRGAINQCQVGDEVEVKIFSTNTRKESTVKLVVDNYNS